MHGHCKFVKIHPAVFQIPRAKDFLPKIKKNLYQMHNFEF